jgi:hypothetical protein
MNSLDKFVMFSIAEKTYEIFKKTKYTTYVNFCNKLNLSINNNVLTHSEKTYLLRIIDEINIIYGFDDREAFKSIKLFFSLKTEAFSEFYKYLIKMENNFPLLFNYKQGLY